MPWKEGTVPTLASGGKALRAHLERRMTQPSFAIGRSVRNALDRARLRQANRLFACRGAGALTREDLQTIDEADITASRVFQR